MVQSELVCSNLIELAHFNRPEHSDLCLVHGNNKLFVRSELLARQSDFFKAKVEHETLSNLSNRNKDRSMTSDLTSSVENYNAIVLFCIWCYAPDFQLLSNDFENLRTICFAFICFDFCCTTCNTFYSNVCLLACFILSFRCFV